MPRQKPGRSCQCYSTPRDFIKAVEKRFGSIEFDLAATPKNSKAKRFYTRRQNSLKQSWPSDLRAWCNPPFRQLKPWAEKCETTLLTPDGSILFLVPASVGANWFYLHVWRKATVYFITPRLCFIRDEPYPKDLILCVYRARRPLPAQQFIYWHWKSELLTNQRGLIYGKHRRRKAA